MHFIAEEYVCLFGICVNFLFMTKLLVRPVLWSTTNTFLCCFLVINLFFLILQLLLIGQDVNEAETEILQSLEYLFSDFSESIRCSAKYVSHFIHGTAILTILLGSIFIRSMMVKHAENIRPDSYERKNHQARVRIIGILVAVYIFTFIVGIVLVLYLHPHSPFDFVMVRICRGIPLTYPVQDKKKIMRAWMSRLVSLTIFAIATLSCHVRIINYKSCHNKLYRVFF